MFTIVFDNIVELQINTQEHDFTTGKSCTTQLLSVYDIVGKHWDEGKQTDMIFFDFSKAIDSVNHNMLIYKLQKLGFSGKLLLWITDYLTDRSQRVVLDGSTSDWVLVTSGVAQGSILGQLLFVLFINAMPDCIEHSILPLFADDGKCLREIKYKYGEPLQRDFSSLFEWSQVWKLNLNVLKCKVNLQEMLLLSHFNINLTELY